jgi:hypothetical protein
VASIFGLVSIVVLYKCIPQTPFWEKKRKEAHFEEFEPSHVFVDFLLSVEINKLGFWV